MKQHELNILLTDRLNSIFSDVSLKAPTMKALYNMLVSAIKSRRFRERFYRAHNFNSFMNHEGDAPRTEKMNPEQLLFIQQCKKFKLTHRETDVMLKKKEALTDDEIARSLSRSPETVNSHLTRIYKKLGVSSAIAALNRLKP